MESTPSVCLYPPRTGLNHLLKSPFCVHPKTGHVCIPFDPRHVTSLEPKNVPTLSQLIEELGAQKSNNTDEQQTKENELPANKHLLAYKRTSLKPSIEYFEAFVRRLCPDGGVGLREQDGVLVNNSGSSSSVPLF